MPRPAADAARPGALFLLGAPRSGTSLLYRCLALHPDAAWINNYHRRLPAVPELAVLDRAAGRLPGLRGRTWFGPDGDSAYRYGSARTALERAFPQPVEGEPVFARRGVLPRGAEPERPGGPACRPERLVSDFARLRRAAGAQVVVSKRIAHNLRVPQLAQLFPDARFVVLTRDGRAVARSLLKVDWWATHHVWWYGGTPADWQREGGDPGELALEHWWREVQAIETGLADVAPERVLRVTYEELVGCPSVTLRRAAAAGGLDPEDRRWWRGLRQVRFPDRNATAAAGASR